MRMVKCHDINEKRPMKESYKAENGKYYTSEQAYEKILHDREMREKCYDIYKKWFNIPDDLMCSTYWMKTVKNYEKYTYDILYATLLQIEDDIQYAITNKTFKTETNTIQYINAIISNNINDVWKQDKAKKINEKRAKSQSFYLADDEIPTIKQKTHDISQFL